MRAALLAVALALAAAAPAAAQTVHASLPLTGATRPEARDVRDAARLALAESGSPVVLRVFDSGSRRLRGWDPRRAAANARRAWRDETVVAYLGELNSGASAVAIPILNAGGIAQVSPSSTYAGLTRPEGGGEPGEPDKYYPQGFRTFFRVAQADHLQARAIAALAARGGAKRVAIVHDGEVYGRGLARLVAAGAAQRGTAVALQARLGRRGRNAAALARRVRAARADAFVFTGVAANGAARMARAVRGIPIIVSDGSFDTAFTRALGPSAARTRITLNVAPASAFGPAGAAFAQRFRARYRRAPGPQAIFGYEAMALILDAIARGGATREGVLNAMRATRDRDSVLGRYSLDEAGDTTLSTFGVYRVRGRRPAFESLIDSTS